MIAVVECNGCELKFRRSCGVLPERLDQIDDRTRVNDGVEAAKERMNIGHEGKVDAKEWYHNGDERR